MSLLITITVAQFLLLVGVVILLVMARRTYRGNFDQDYHTPLEMSALYWHLVDLVWIFVFPLMYLIGRAG